MRGANKLQTDEESSSEAAPKLNKKEINNLLKYGAYDIFRDEDNGEQFYEDDIDRILERNSKTVVHEAAGL